MEHPDHDLIALGIRQPWAELILRGIKTVEIRTLPTRIRGPVYLYTGKNLADGPPARDAMRQHRLCAEELPTGVVVGTVNVVDCRMASPDDAAAACIPATLLEGKLSWHLAAPNRLEEPLCARFVPYGIWFYPFKRRSTVPRRRK